MCGGCGVGGRISLSTALNMEDQKSDGVGRPVEWRVCSEQHHCNRDCGVGGVVWRSDVGVNI